MHSQRFSIRRNVALIALLMVAALSISGCGNKGPLTHPAEKPATTR